MSEFNPYQVWYSHAALADPSNKEQKMQGWLDPEQRDLVEVFDTFVTVPPAYRNASFMANCDVIGYRIRLRSGQVIDVDENQIRSLDEVAELDRIASYEHPIVADRVEGTISTSLISSLRQPNYLGPEEDLFSEERRKAMFQSLEDDIVELPKRPIVYGPWIGVPDVIPGQYLGVYILEVEENPKDVPDDHAAVKVAFVEVLEDDTETLSVCILSLGQEDFGVVTDPRIVSQLEALQFEVFQADIKRAGATIRGSKNSWADLSFHMNIAVHGKTAFGEISDRAHGNVNPKSHGVSLELLNRPPAHLTKENEDFDLAIEESRLG